jgi:histidyl-tRNA synthetase
MRDYLPADMLVREEMLDKVRKTFRLWGFAPLATPAIEYKEILAGKYGDTADRLIYSLAHSDGLALRYDLTVPLSRAIAMYPELPMPFKRYQIQEVWRAERAQPQQGRFREFLQCDVDIAGTSSLAADGEILALSIKILGELGFPNAVTRVNHRKILRGLMEVSNFPPGDEMEICRVVDKLDKLGEHGVRNELLSEGFNSESIEKLFSVILTQGSNDELLNLIEGRYGGNLRIAEGVNDIRAVLISARNFGAPEDKLKITLALSRGLDYYTGTIFESAIPEQPHIGSLTGGGRYDDLIGLFSGKEIPAVGITIGLDRILAALADAGKISSKSTPTKILVSVFDEKHLPDSIGLARDLRNSGIAADVYLGDKKLKQQFAYADKLKIPFVAILGEDEINKGTVALKNMTTGDQSEVSFEELAEKLMS